jgi:hypothetical protein
MTLKVYDHNKFRLFDYENEKSDGYQLGHIVTKVSEYEEDGETKTSTEIGVVIQTFSDGDFRTDMFGMASPSEVTPSTLEEIEVYRNDLLGEVNQLSMKDK